MLYACYRDEKMTREYVHEFIVCGRLGAEGSSSDVSDAVGDLHATLKTVRCETGKARDEQPSKAAHGWSPHAL